ncbi:DUF3597 domain-containing protein [bacterium]|nr:DUF3597 domain-containing protein [bacterium]
MATLNTGTSVVDYLKSTGKDSSYNSRASLATQYGITGYSGSAEQNTALLNALKKGSAPSSPSGVNDSNSATNYINANQESDQALASKSGDVPVRSSVQSYSDIFKNLQETITGANVKPTAPSFEQTYNSLVGQYGISDLESSLNDLTNQENEIRAQFRVNKAGEEGKPVAMNVIEGRVSEQERASNERLDTVLREKDYITNQLKSKYDVVNNIMNLKQLDYKTASDEYNNSFSQNLQLFNTVKGIADSEKSDLEREQDNARANAQIIYNSIQSGGLKVEDITPDQKLSITKLEMQSGLPVGFYETLQNKNPKADIVTSTSRESNGAKYVDVIMRNEDGSLSTKSMYVGAVDAGGSGSKPTEAETVRSNATKVATQLKTVAGGDGYVSPENYKKARLAWVTAGYTAKDFDQRFGTTFVNPDSYDLAGVSSSALD